MKPVLLVEDDDNIRDSMRMLLEWEGYTVVTARNGKEGLDKLDSSIGLVLLDLMMPVMDGWEFLKRRRENPAWLKSPVVVVSAAFPAEHDASAFKAPEVSAVLHKPLESEELLQHVAVHCR